MDPVTLCMLSHSSISQAGQNLCTSNVAACNQLVTQLVTSQQDFPHPDLPILAEFALCAVTHVIVCILVDCLLCSMTNVLAKGFLSHVKHVAVSFFTVCLACR